MGMLEPSIFTFGFRRADKIAYVKRDKDPSILRR